MAQRTGLEPATPGVTGRYSNRLNYRCASAGLSSDSQDLSKQGHPVPGWLFALRGAQFTQAPYPSQQANRDFFKKMAALCDHLLDQAAVGHLLPEKQSVALAY